jgi:hypothetical protein
MMKLLIISVTLCALLCGCTLWTRSQEKAARAGADAAGSLFGIPPLITDTVFTAALALTHYLAHKNGRRVERKQAKAA